MAHYEETIEEEIKEDLLTKPIEKNKWKILKMMLKFVKKK